ncbi:MAG TPA: hypothetical protein VM406_12290 [Noviherbaspirillum sp.]|nr:hypothetical protein [Noviherbaspirillum sp.]
MKKLSTLCILAALIAPFPAVAAQPVERGGARAADADSAGEPRDPSAFSYGEYHRSSKMTPGGSQGPEVWGEERTDVGPPLPASGAQARGGQAAGSDEPRDARADERGRGRDGGSRGRGEEADKD